ncbi:MAG: hypothetical protein HC890_05890 [Chloroflexaceae bacterium]|nr:hypothetical protein [Chloroflexaceae bacterium]
MKQTKTPWLRWKASPRPWPKIEAQRLGPEREDENGYQFRPQLSNLEVILGDRFRIRRNPFYNFQVAGDLVLNGPVTELRRIQPSGVLLVEGGDISLINTRFNLARRLGEENVVVFEPEEGLFNPFIDVQLVTFVTEVDDVTLDTGTRQFSIEQEVRESVFLGSGANSVRVTVAVEGEASEIIPALALNPDEVCGVASNPFPITEQVSYPPEQLQQLSDCVQTGALYQDNPPLIALDSPAVDLLSSPPRSNSQIISLLGNQFIGLAEQLSNSNPEELVQFGIANFVIAPLTRGVLFAFQQRVSNAGRGVGLADLQVVPALEASYAVGPESFVIFDYDYLINQVGVRYETRLAIGLEHRFSNKTAKPEKPG